MNNTYLAHYGVLGMKWGVRRYQNKDGSLTEAGRKRMNEALLDAEKMSKIHARLEDTNRSLTNTSLGEKKKILVSTEMKEDFSNQIKQFVELNDVFNKKYKNVMSEIITKNGKDYVYTLLEDKETGFGAEYITKLHIQNK